MCTLCVEPVVCVCVCVSVSVIVCVAVFWIHWCPTSAATPCRYACSNLSLPLCVCVRAPTTASCVYVPLVSLCLSHDTEVLAFFFANQSFLGEVANLFRCPVSAAPSRVCVRTRSYNCICAVWLCASRFAALVQWNRVCCACCTQLCCGCCTFGVARWRSCLCAQFSLCCCTLSCCGYCTLLLHSLNTLVLLSCTGAAAGVTAAGSGVCVPAVCVRVCPPALL